MYAEQCKGCLVGQGYDYGSEMYVRIAIRIDVVRDGYLKEYPLSNNMVEQLQILVQPLQEQIIELQSQLENKENNIHGSYPAIKRCQELELENKKLRSLLARSIAPIVPVKNEKMNVEPILIEKVNESSSARNRGASDQMPTLPPLSSGKWVRCESPSLHPM